MMSGSAAAGAELNRRQDALHGALNLYVNRGVAIDAGRTGRLRAVLSPRAGYSAGAVSLSAALRELHSQLPRPAGAATDITVPAYRGTTRAVERMMQALRPLTPELRAAIVHGSLGSDDAIGYSDFDAFVVLRNTAVESPARLAATAFALGALQQLMVEFDPLQHHGWMVVTEADLEHYNDAWFPARLLDCGCSLLDGAPHVLRVWMREPANRYRPAFDALATATQQRLRRPRFGTDAYETKNTLSQFMLLPSLYLQARDGTVVYKRESFAIAARDFSPVEWEPMATASDLRREWRYVLPAPGRWLYANHHRSRTLATRLPLARLPADLGARLDAGFRDRATALITAMARRLPTAEPR